MILQSTIDWAVANRQSYWKGSVFEEIRELSNDERGRWGEKLIYELISQCTDFSVYWDQDSNTQQDDGTYDLVVNGHRVEVKTSFGGHSGNWQHENIYNEDFWDKCVMVDVDYDCVYFTCIDRAEMTWDSKHPVFQKTPTRYKHQTVKHKFDFSRRSLTLGQEGGLTTRWMVGDPDDSTITWWRTKFA